MKNINKSTHLTELSLEESIHVEGGIIPFAVALYLAAGAVTAGGAAYGIGYAIGEYAGYREKEAKK